MICSIEGCGEPKFARGWCAGHYLRNRRYGDPLGGGTAHGEPLRFVRSVALLHTGPGCLVWPFSKGGGQYGRIFNPDDGGYRIASRVVCEEAHGMPPHSDMEAAHSCGNASCVNPNHLSWKTPKGNSDDKDIHGTKPLGVKSGKAKLTEDAVRAIRAAMRPTRELAEEYGVHTNTIRVIQRGLRWGWLS